MNAKSNNLTQSTIISRRNILHSISVRKECSAGDLAEMCSISVPTASKMIRGLVREGLVRELGHRHKKGGRMPMMYCINPGIGRVIGIDIRKDGYYFGVMDFSGDIKCKSGFVGFKLDEDTPAEDFAHNLLNTLKDNRIDISTVKHVTISVPGRVDVNSGESFNYFRKGDKTAREIIRAIVGTEVTIDNDSRLMCFGEYIEGSLFGHKNILYINIGWGLGMGMILEGRLFYGANGFSGELGHISIFDNEIFCRCGKKGCLETEASGSAAYRQLRIRQDAGARSTLSRFLEQKTDITPEMLAKAVADGDMLMIEIIEELGAQLGKGIAAMINVLNPELVILGGPISMAGDHLLMAAVNSTRKYSINIVNRATKIILGSCNEDITVIGACHLSRVKYLERI